MVCVGGVVVSLSSFGDSGSCAGAAHFWESMDVREDSRKGAGAAHRDCEDVVVVARFGFGEFFRAAAVAAVIHAQKSSP